MRKYKYQIHRYTALLFLSPLHLRLVIPILVQLIDKLVLIIQTTPSANSTSDPACSACANGPRPEPVGVDTTVP